MIVVTPDEINRELLRRNVIGWTFVAHNSALFVFTPQPSSPLNHHSNYIGKFLMRALKKP